jgi:hypothetical protein
MARIQVKGTEEFLKNMRRLEAEVLPDLGKAVRAEAAEVLDASQMLVPVESGRLKASGFVDGPHVNRARHSVSATVGYDHPEAGAIHEGSHWGIQLKAPKFLQRPARAARKRFVERIAASVRATLSRFAVR